MTLLRRTSACLLLLALAGCITDYKLVDSDGPDSGTPPGDGDGDGDGDGNPGGTNGGGTGGAGTGGTTGGSSGASGTGGTVPDDVCLRGGACAQIASVDVTKLDLLFMIDNSASMRDEQASLRAQLPRLINVLTSGDMSGDGTQDFSPAKDLHLGIVSPDLGLPGVVGIDGCNGLGDDGVLRSQASPEVSSCSVTNFNPPFLTYNRDNGDNPEQLATDLSCIATLGTDGCGFEQPLESTLKALWPGSDDAIRFVTDPATMFGQTGQAGPGFPNGDFLRPDSLLGIVIVTDEEDCSSNNMSHFVPSASDTGLNTRCFFEGLRAEPNNLFDVERYVAAFQALRPGNEGLVVFSAIVGVPPQLVTPEVLADIDFENPSERDAFYDGLLAAPEMQETLDPRGNQDPADDNLLPSCDRGLDARAYPPRRIVQVAKAFGANSAVQSICQEDFGPAINAIVDRLARQLGTVCLPRPIERGSDGTVMCDVIWALPESSDGGAPTACNQRDFLKAIPGIEDGGNVLCKVQQLPVRQNSAGEMEPVPAANGVTDGFYYDDFSDDTMFGCTGTDKQRIAFSPEAQPPTGVSVYLDCE